MLRFELLESRDNPSDTFGVFPTDPTGPINPPTTQPVVVTPTVPPPSQGDVPPSNVPPTNPTGPINP